MRQLEWLPIRDLPERLKDGRDVLLWNGESLEAVIGVWDCLHGGPMDWYCRDQGLLVPNVTFYLELTEPY